MPDNEDILFGREDGVATVTLNPSKTFLMVAFAVVMCSSVAPLLAPRPPRCEISLVVVMLFHSV